MNINATASPDYLVQRNICDFDPVAVPLGNNGEDEPERVAQPSSGPSLSAIQKQFATLIRDLTQQLSSLEKQLMQSLRQLTSQPPEAEGGIPPGPNSAPPAQSGYPAMQPYGKIITDAARRHEVDPLLVGAVIGQESGFRADAVSKAGAVGLMQLMPDTARSLGVRDALNPQQNVEGGTSLLRQLLDRYNGHLDLALAAYNAGPEAVDKYGGIPPFPETQAYVRNVMESYRASALST